MPSRSKSLLPKIVRFAYKDNMRAIPPNPTHAPALYNDDTPPTRTYALPPVPARPSRRGSLPVYAYTHYSPPSNHYNHTAGVAPHRYLAPHGIAWDMRDAPTAITRAGHPISGRALYEPACTPPVSFMRLTLITSTGVHLPWGVKVYGSHDGFVTLDDVVAAVYGALRVNITQGDYTLLRGRDDHDYVTQAYQDRYRRMRSDRAYADEKRAGLKRVDFLMGRTRWVGLEQYNAKGPDEWILRLG